MSAVIATDGCSAFLVGSGVTSPAVFARDFESGLPSGATSGAAGTTSLDSTVVRGARSR